KHLHVLRDHREHVEGDMSLHVGGVCGNQDIQIDATKKEHVKGTSHLHVEQGRIEWVQNGQSLTADGNRKEYVSGVDTLRVHGPRLEQVDEGDYLHVGGDRFLVVDGELHARGDKAVAVTSGSKIYLYAPDEIVLSVGSSRIRIDASGIKLDGPSVQNNCSPETFIVLGPVVPAPLPPDKAADAEPAKPDDPAPAGASKSGQKSCPDSGGRPMTTGTRRKRRVQTVALAADHALHVERPDLLTLRDADGRVRVAIHVTAAGPVLRFEGDALTVQAAGDL